MYLLAKQVGVLLAQALEGFESNEIIKLLLPIPNIINNYLELIYSLVPVF